MGIVLQWIDLCWLGLAFAIARRDQRGWVIGFFAGNMLMMRLMSELMDSIGHPDGLMGFLPRTPVHTRGLVVYSLCYMVYMLFIYFSPNAKGVLLMAASIALFFISFFATAFVMVL